MHSGTIKKNGFGRFLQVLFVGVFINNIALVLFAGKINEHWQGNHPSGKSGGEGMSCEN